MRKRIVSWIGSLLFITGVAIILLKQGIFTEHEMIAIVIAYFFVRGVYHRNHKQRILRSSLRKIDGMTGIEFEEYLMYQFRKRGYRVVTTPVTGDFGADLIIKKRRYSCIVQAKRYRGSVGIKAVQEALGAMQYYDVDHAMVITNSYYTKAARELADACEIELWGRKEIMEEFGCR